MKTFKIGNTSFNLENLAFSTKAEFMKIYDKPVFKFDKEDAWNELKKHVAVKTNG